ncbi:type II toxin-antitoxin system RelE/ParE family toxin [Algiphilus aromaticivorans]|uniref:type II toxin-antitoxin system RelE/ParE family toxin n=1 Tax=Algiphilus aromaticivorans TaxID=382454 RepID=UPI0018DE39E2|nr:type II toxin-antitoxin system RelE/ParE family toxin [Algiphilus aromaticivorans]
MKPVIWLGSSKADWDRFPASVQDDGGYQIDKLQRGEMPSDWKPMSTIGAGVCELRIRDEVGAFRAWIQAASATLPAKEVCCGDSLSTLGRRGTRHDHGDDPGRIEHASGR